MKDGKGSMQGKCTIGFGSLQDIDKINETRKRRRKNPEQRLKNEKIQHHTLE